ncbi:glycosyltransferase family 2 protein [Lamprobacter modestohalophilus]|uniref:glycosyltransferase family 2 protein n=1 Tax=Lamprobacter modestohalophilus TaxID=1064514 RepID=UPI002ADED8AB|nr:glycosyltransferase family 2 protein [Lamprobacter modestohalophilus]MEA1052533.1 glycosyltransferase family 2 protein [Lamprobacter modestohalophilus]
MRLRRGLRRGIVLIPAYNEAGSIGTIVAATRRHWHDPIVVIDDRSRDATAALAEQAGATVLRLPLRLGAWGATQTGLRFAYAQGYTHAVTLDADGQHRPCDIGDVAAPILSGDADVAIGACPSRASLARRFAWSYFRRLSGLSYEDITSGFRAYNRTAMKLLIRPSATLLDYQDVGVLMILRRHRLRVHEVSVPMHSRVNGKSHIFASWRKVAEYMVVTSLLAFAGIGTDGKTKTTEPN